METKDPPVQIIQMTDQKADSDSNHSKKTERQTHRRKQDHLSKLKRLMAHRRRRVCYKSFKAEEKLTDQDS